MISREHFIEMLGRQMGMGKGHGADIDHLCHRIETAPSDVAGVRDILAVCVDGLSKTEVKALASAIIIAYEEWNH